MGFKWEDHIIDPTWDVKSGPKSWSDMSWQDNNRPDVQEQQQAGTGNWSSMQAAQWLEEIWKSLWTATGQSTTGAKTELDNDIEESKRAQEEMQLSLLEIHKQEHDRLLQNVEVVEQRWITVLAAKEKEGQLRSILY